MVSYLRISSPVTINSSNALSNDNTTETSSPNMVIWNLDGSKWSKITSTAYISQEIVSSTPTTYYDAITHSNSEGWRSAMDHEINALDANQTFIPKDLPKGRKALSTRWVYAIKSDGRLRARLVAKGFLQKEGTDYIDVFAPVADLVSLRTIIAIATIQNWDIDHLDVETAFLNGDMDTEVYIKPPLGYKNQTLLLKKALYGTKQGARQWHIKFTTTILQVNFIQLKTDSSIFIKHYPNGILILLLYVDDILLTGSNSDLITDFKGYLNSQFKMKNLGPVKLFLGIEIIRDREKRVTYLHQRQYVNDALDKYKLSDANIVSTPALHGQILTNETPFNLEYQMQLPYRNMIGTLNYLVSCTRPDISCAVNSLSKFQESFGQTEFTAVKRIFRYLKGTQDYALKFTHSSSDMILQGFVDADFANSPDRKSITGYTFLLSSCCIAWKTRKQPTISLSTVESEYIALAVATSECIWIKQFLSELGYDQRSTVIFEDNQGCIALAKNPIVKSRVKHVDIKYHFIRDMIHSKQIDLQFISTKNQCADIFTKALPRDTFQHFISVLNLVGMGGTVETHT